MRNLDELSKTHGPENDFAVKVLTYLLGHEAKYGNGGGSPMYDPLAVGAAIDPSIVTTQAMHVDVETRGEFSRGETVANRRNAVEDNVLHGDRYVIEGIGHVKPKRASLHGCECRQIFAAAEFAAGKENRRSETAIFQFEAFALDVVRAKSV